MLHCDETLGNNSCSPTVVQKKNPTIPNHTHKKRQNAPKKRAKPSLFHPLHLLSYCLLFYLLSTINLRRLQSFKLSMLCASLAAQSCVLLMGHKGWELLERQLLSLGKCLTLAAHFSPLFLLFFNYLCNYCTHTRRPLSHGSSSLLLSRAPAIHGAEPWGSGCGAALLSAGLSFCC